MLGALGYYKNYFQKFIHSSFLINIFRKKIHRKYNQSYCGHSVIIVYEKPSICTSYCGIINFIKKLNLNSSSMITFNSLFRSEINNIYLLFISEIWMKGSSSFEYTCILLFNNRISALYTKFYHTPKNLLLLQCSYIR